MKYIMKGGNPLSGDVHISGSKNATLALLAAAIMTDEDVILDNIPNVSDIEVMINAMKEIGVDIKRISEHRIIINGANINKVTVDNEHIRKIRAGYYLVGALLGKYRHAEVALPGGCDIGQRPIDYHIKAFRSLGATVTKTESMLIADGKNLHGGNQIKPVSISVSSSVGATINAMLAAILAPGKTFIKEAAKEPHVVDVANMLNLMGADISGAGTDNIRIIGKQSLRGVEYQVIPDQIEAGTYMFAAAITEGDITVCDVTPQHMTAISSKLREMGCEVESSIDEGNIRVVGKYPIRTTNARTQPHPGFPTDMQPQLVVALAIADGNAVVTENIFESRFKYVEELNKMGAIMNPLGKKIMYIEGVERLKGTEIVAPDLRAGAALVLAGLSAEGITIVDDIQYILRGYEDFAEKLKSLGAQIECVETEEEEREFINRFAE